MSAFGAGIKVAEVAFGAGLLEHFVGVDGLQGVTDQLFALVPKIAIKAARVDHAAMSQMLDLMHNRVPQDTGLLYNGINGHWQGSVGSVTASAQRTGGNGKLSADYAHFVEFGTKPHQVADAAYFDSSGGHRSSRATAGHPGTEAQPFFYNSADEVLAKRHGEILGAANDAIGETGMGG
ncbi:hypothetical protein SAMN05519104_6672 [Rhizobiales bacterium GAS188]|nr:hypothetical protein SAMN05519104_6672 [Rhizobiales bacterium GAS188]